MIARQVGEHRNIERHAEHALLRQRVRRNFHDRVGRAQAERLVEKTRQFERFRRGMRRRINLAGHVIFNRPDQRALAPCGGQDRLDQKRRRALAVRPGNSRDRNALGGTLVEIRAQARQSPPPMRHHGPGHAFARLLARRIRDHRDRTGLNRLVDEAIPVGRLAAHGHEHASRLDPARVVFHATDAGVPALGENLRAIQQMLEGHCWEL